MLSKNKKKSSTLLGLIITLIVAIPLFIFVSVRQNKNEVTKVSSNKENVQKEDSNNIKESANSGPEANTRENIEDIVISVTKTLEPNSQEVVAVTSNLDSRLTSDKSTVPALTRPGIQDNLGNDESRIKIKLNQTTNAGQGISEVYLSSHGDLDWAAWDGGKLLPKQRMKEGKGFNGFTAIGATTFKAGSFYSQNKYSWTNGASNSVNSSSLAGSASVFKKGDGIRLKVDVQAAGAFQLKFYVSTYDVNFSAKAYLSSGIVVENANGNYVSNSVERYEYTVDFTTEGADTLTLDLVKSDGVSFIVAQEAFSLKSVRHD